MASLFQTGYQGYFNPAQNATIAMSSTESSAIPCNGFVLVGLLIPAAFTGTALTFEVCSTIDGTYQTLYDSSNTAVSMTVAAGRAYAVDPKNFQGVAFLKIVSGTSEAADRTIICSLKGF